MTLAEIETDLLDYANFEEVLNVARAKSFVTAANRWLILRSESASSNSQSMSISKQYVNEMKARAQAFIAANGSAANGQGSMRVLVPSETFR